MIDMHDKMDMHYLFYMMDLHDMHGFFIDMAAVFAWQRWYRALGGMSGGWRMQVAFWGSSRTKPLHVSDM